MPACLTYCLFLALKDGREGMRDQMYTLCLHAPHLRRNPLLLPCTSDPCACRLVKQAKEQVPFKEIDFT